MRLVLQRVAHASLTVDGEAVGEIGRGLCAFVGISDIDDEAAAEWGCHRLLNTCLWEDGTGNMLSTSVFSGGFEMLIVPQPMLCSVLNQDVPILSMLWQEQEKKTDQPITSPYLSSPSSLAQYPTTPHHSLLSGRGLLGGVCFPCGEGASEKGAAWALRCHDIGGTTERWAYADNGLSFPSSHHSRHAHRSHLTCRFSHVRRMLLLSPSAAGFVQHTIKVGQQVLLGTCRAIFRT